MTSVVMICRGRYRLLAQAIESLRENTERESYNVVFVHDSLSDDFRVGSLLKRVAGGMSNAQLVTLENSDHVLARMKNLGVAWSEQTWGRGDWLYLSDSDVWFSPGWLEALTLQAENSEDLRFRLWGGQVHPFHVGIPIPQWGITEHSVLDGPSWLMRWDTWSRIGGLSRKCAPGVGQSEEYPFCSKLLAGGGRIGVIHPHAVVHTGLTQTDGKDAPGREEREKTIPKGVIAE